ncbi:unnamed protein product, partial [Amoebophrya sp. A120]|eukprot:GSA120T00020441001.1
MSVKAIREYHGKCMIYKNLKAPFDNAEYKGVLVTPSLWQSSDIHFAWDEILAKHPWLKTEKLVVKPDQLIKRRGK